jgi:uncharacterized membrane protein
VQRIQATTLTISDRNCQAVVRETRHVLVSIFAAAVMMATMAVPVLAQQGPEILQVTDSENYADQQMRLLIQTGISTLLATTATT